MFDQYGNLCVDMCAEDETETRPEIDRRALRDLLMSSLHEGTVIWDRQLLHLVPAGEKLRLVFAQGEVVADLVVGCDGAWSRVRPLITTTRP